LDVIDVLLLQALVVGRTGAFLVSWRCNFSTDKKGQAEDSRHNHLTRDFTLHV
jgi:hypothetical protein